MWSFIMHASIAVRMGMSLISSFSEGTNGDITYDSIVGDEFSIHPVTGVITTTKALDREVQGVYAVTGTSTDRH